MVHHNLPNSVVRLLSALVLAPLVLMIVFMGGVWFHLLMLCALMVLAMEWQGMTANLPKLPWLLGGVAYLVVPILSILYVRDLPDGRAVVFWILCVVWMTDICAYIVGRSIGGPKLAPSISPGKTWSGLCGGIMGGFVTGLLFSLIIGTPDVVMVALLSVVIAFLSQGGDLLESKVKRYCQVKDSGTLIPGHGGLLDRVDGMMLVVPVVACFKFLSERGPFLWS
jgi:phosphatidate cytidylyltransferase